MGGYIGSKASVVSSGAERKQTYAITTTTTSLTGLAYTPTKVHVYHNGIRLVDGTDYTATNGTSITLTNAAENGDEVVVISYATFQTSDTVSAANGGTFAGNVDFTGSFTSLGIDDNATSTAMTLDSTGNVGIGTNSPTTPLDVTKAGGGNFIATFQNTTSATPYGVFIKEPASAANGYPTLNVTDSTGTDTRFRVDSGTGNVGIGQAPSNFSGWKVLEMKGGTNGAMLNFEDNSSTRVHVLASAEAGLFRMQTLVADPITFETNNTERMRLHAGGNLTLKRVTVNHGGIFCMNYTGGTSSGIVLTDDSPSGTGVPMQIVNSSNTIIGSITHNQSSTSYNTSSDYRLKENVTDVTDGITRVKQLAPKRFNFIADPDTTVDGFLAHEAAIAVPEAVTGTKDAMRDEEYEVTPAVLDDDGNVVTEAVMGTRSVPDYQGIDQSKLVPLLTAALQEAIAKIETLETKVAALESA